MTALPTPAPGDEWGGQLNAAITELIAGRAAVPVRRSTGPVTLTPFTGGNGGTWTLYPMSLRVTIPAAAGDLLVVYPAIIGNSGPAEGDMCSVVSGAPARYYSSGTASQATNGHGALYLDGAFGLAQTPALTWVVASADIESGNVTLSLMYRTGSARSFGSSAYPSTVDVVNHGPSA
jgi:hypothetical protein